MPSQINTTNINLDYPVAGANNPVTGFYTNWTSIANNLIIAANELTDLMNKAVLTAPLTDGANVVINNLNNVPVSGGVYTGQSLGIVAHGTLTTTTTENFDFSLGAVHTITLDGTPATTTVNPINFPGNGYSEIQLHITVSSVTHTLSFSGLTLIGNLPAGLNTTTNGFLFSTTGSYIIILGSDDGENWFLKSNALAKAREYTPASSIGAAGDTIGQIAYDSNYIYVCTGNYNGSSNIWIAASVSGSPSDSATWGDITGTLSNQTDLLDALNDKANAASLAAVATTGAYSSLSGTPSIPAAPTLFSGNLVGTVNGTNKVFTLTNDGTDLTGIPALAIIWDNYPVAPPLYTLALSGGACTVTFTNAPQVNDVLYAEGFLTI